MLDIIGANKQKKKHICLFKIESLMIESIIKYSYKNSMRGKVHQVFIRT